MKGSSSREKRDFIGLYPAHSIRARNGYSRPLGREIRSAQIAPSLLLLLLLPSLLFYDSNFILLSPLRASIVLLVWHRMSPAPSPSEKKKKIRRSSSTNSSFHPRNKQNPCVCEGFPALFPIVLSKFVMHLDLSIKSGVEN